MRIKIGSLVTDKAELIDAIVDIDEVVTIIQEDASGEYELAQFDFEEIKALYGIILEKKMSEKIKFDKWRSK